MKLFHMDRVKILPYSLNTQRIQGQAWILSDGWLPIPDDEVLPESKYVIKVVSMAEHRYIAVRIDTITVRSWSSINNRWVEIKTK
jgi:hypothetical protein